MNKYDTWEYKLGVVKDSLWRAPDSYCNYLKIGLEYSNLELVENNHWISMINQDNDDKIKSFLHNQLTNRAS